MRRTPRAVVLPGRAYPVTGLALAPVVAVIAQHGYDVGAAQWSLAELPDDPADFVVSRLVEIAPDGADLVVAKSMGCWASTYASERAVAGVWVTPVLTDPVVAVAIRTNPAPQLVIAGLDDPFHDPVVAAGLGCDLLELPGADHALSSTGDHVVAPDILGRLADATDDFLRRHPWQG